MITFNDVASATTEVRDQVTSRWRDVVDTSRFVGGEPVEDFERAWADFCGAHYTVGVGNGTDALHLTLRALDIGPGDEVVVPANTFVATVEAIVLAGAVPRFADVDPQTLLLTGDTLKAAATPATRAAIAVHLYGQPVDMDSVGVVAGELGIELIADSAQAHGARWKSHRIGSLARAACFSFYPGKNLGAFGDAGAVVTSDPIIVERLRSMRDHGRSTHHQHETVGTNSRMDTLQAVVLSAKLPRLDDWNTKRRTLMEHYRAHLDPAVSPPVALARGAESSHHLAVVRVAHRERVRHLLSAQGVETGVHYPSPCHLMDPYQQYCHEELPVCEAAASEILSLPMHPYLKFDDIERVCTELSTAAHEAMRE